LHDVEREKSAPAGDKHREEHPQKGVHVHIVYQIE
jgi:hypothetical protein